MADFMREGPMSAAVGSLRKVIRFSAHAPRAGNSYVIADLRLSPTTEEETAHGLRRPAAISPAQVKRSVDRGNQVYASTGIHFVYKTSDGMLERKSTLLNNPPAIGDRDWLQFKRAGNQLAAEHPGKLTLIFRHGPGPRPTGGGFSLG